MSFLPFLLEELSCPTVYDQHFGLGLLDDDMLVPHDSYVRFPSALRGYKRPWPVTSTQSGLSQIRSDKDSFKVNLDVQQFEPDEISAKVVDDFIVIDGKHEERSDEHGFISRQFTRRYQIPKNVDGSTIISSLSSDGVLSIGGAPKKVEDKKDERTIPIVQTNRLSIKIAGNNEKEVDKMKTS